MKDALLEEILDRLQEEAVDIGSDLIKDGVNLLKEYLDGRASDDQIIAWMRQHGKRAS